MFPSERRVRDARWVEAVERLDLEQALRRALGRSEFRLFYQPVLDVETGTIMGVEALLRWSVPSAAYSGRRNSSLSRRRRA